MQTKQWSLQDAKNKFSAVVDAARQGKAQVITQGNDVAIFACGVLVTEALAAVTNLTHHPFLAPELAIPHESAPSREPSRASAPAARLSIKSLRSPPNSTEGGRNNEEKCTW